MQPVLDSNKLVIASGDMSGDLSSQVIDLANVYGFCVHATYTGSPVGTLIVQGSNNPAILGWHTIDSNSISSAGNYFDNKDGQHYAFLQIIYTFTSGTGTLNVAVSGKRSS